MTETLGALERVFGAFEKHHGYSPDELDAAERRLGITLPGALRLFYERTGRHPFHTAQNKLVAPDQLGFDADRLVFYDENQGVCAWGIVEGALASDDPPVDVSVMTEEGTEYVPEFPSVSDFLAAQAAWQAVATLPWAGLILEPHEVAGHGTVAPRRVITRTQAEVIGELLGANEESDVRSRPDAIALVSSQGYFSLAARDEATFREIAAALEIDDGDWAFFAPRDS